MADNVLLNLGSGGDTIAADDIAGVKHELVKVEFGPDGAATQVADTPGARLPVKIGQELPAGTQNIGDVDLAQYTPVSGRLPVDGSGVTQPVSVAATVNTDPVDDPLRDNGKIDVASLDQYTPVSGRLPVDGSGVTQPVSIAATVAVDPTDEPTRDNGKIDIASLDQYTPVSGRLPVDGSGVTQPVSIAAIVAVNGDVAHDAVDSGNPVKIGAKASGSVQTAVANLDRVDSYVDRQGRLITRPWGAGDWTQVHTPAANTRATTTRSAGASGVRHVATGFTVTLAAGTTAPAAVTLTVELRDGASGAGTILWQSRLNLGATTGVTNSITVTNLNLRGTAATAMTLEFSAAGGANTFESVSLQGIDITEA